MKPLPFPRLAAAALLAAALAPFASHGEALNPPVKVRYEEVVRSILYVPKYVALSQGYFKDAGLDVSMKTSQGTDKGMALPNPKTVIDQQKKEKMEDARTQNERIMDSGGAPPSTPDNQKP